MLKNGLESIEEALKKEGTRQRTYKEAENAKVGRKKKDSKEKAVPITIYFPKEEYESFKETMEEEFELNQGYFIRKIVAKYIHSRQKNKDKE
ncbi:hypothetical protein [Campylobacter sp. MIT 97-5078]|uniref:hypothetical protein n=1 Tax=Campylobacter sp. MIT 97-5078 TaxID=1548153 RepID=UPI0005134953|nr:hypothetical protein [Campylobacter sp. MIT 97-5078]KGI55835.1 hypothetical protein LR59_10185 [Campylobacter sp. MIT 97-5078]KGI56831.1 hypothetical protein LR59_04950 [Campylobacter sp. MIT 97-5078]TQR25609.1 hypothetical protein DMB91_07340 [Campylobacter sp. MIT 97-5078]